MFSGSFVALITPMSPHGDIDYRALELLIAWHLSNDTDGFVILGTTGESSTVAPAERAKIIAFVMSLVAHKKPVVVGTGTNNTQQSIELTQQALQLGADAALLITPYYNKPTQEGLYQHYAAIAKAVPIPQILYNCPSRTACDLLPETMARLKSEQNIVAIKETVHDLNRYRDILEQTHLALLGGNDENAFELLQVGGQGIISVAANVIPKEFSALCRCTLLGDYDQAKKLDQYYQPLFDALFFETNPIPTKWALHAMKMIDRGIRLPLTWLSVSHEQRLKTVLKDRGLI